MTCDYYYCISVVDRLLVSSLIWGFCTNIYQQQKHVFISIVSDPGQHLVLLNFLIFTNFMWNLHSPPPFFNVYLFLRETETELERGRGRERARHRIRNRLQAPSCQHRARAGLKLTDREIMTWAEVGRLTDWATQAPLHFPFNEVIIFLKKLKKSLF